MGDSIQHQYFPRKVTIRTLLTRIILKEEGIEHENGEFHFLSR